MLYCNVPAGNWLAGVREPEELLLQLTQVRLQALLLVHDQVFYDKYFLPTNQCWYIGDVLYYKLSRKEKKIL